ncbi:hypothetical protein [Rhizobium sp. P38BS-XIX]|uniref:hypothetical protein n=1 Tax=Rhizobium sp. P38BS-XIX TaxID=2726740 RepID=UPI001FF05B0E|nr:hypothetical protein [Rhizobium sp. P38BS-XIX]
MARSTHIYAIDDVATMIGEDLELLHEIAANTNVIEMAHVHNSTEDGTTGLPGVALKCLQELPAEIRSWDGGARGSASS